MQAGGAGGYGGGRSWQQQGYSGTGANSAPLGGGGGHQAYHQGGATSGVNAASSALDQEKDRSAVLSARRHRIDIGSGVVQHLYSRLFTGRATRDVTSAGSFSSQIRHTRVSSDFHCRFRLGPTFPRARFFAMRA